MSPKIRGPHPQLVNPRVLIVGPAPDENKPLPLVGFPIEFTSIKEAMDSIPYFDPSEDTAHNYTDEYTILVTPGYYQEVIRCKPFVNIVGLGSSVFIQAPPASTVDFGGRPAAAVYLSSFSLVSGVTLLSRQDSSYPDVVLGYDWYNGTPDVHFLGMSDVNIWAAGPDPTQPAAKDGYAKAALIHMEGDWHTAIFRSVSGNYYAPNGYGIQLIGKYVRRGAGNVPATQNADCHFIDCFFDALFLNERRAILDGGVFWIQDCYEVHIRNSLVRTGAMAPLEDGPPLPTFGRAVATRTSTANLNPPGLTNVLIEGSSLYGGEHLLDVGAGTTCYFNHSTADSRTGNGEFIARPDPSHIDGIGLRT